MEDLLDQIGSRILSRRKQLRMTQEELAEKAGITSQTVSSAELGKKALRPENTIRLPSSYSIPPSGGYYQQFYPCFGRTGSTERKVIPSLCFLAAPKC